MQNSPAHQGTRLSKHMYKFIVERSWMEHSNEVITMLWIVVLAGEKESM